MPWYSDFSKLMSLTSRFSNQLDTSSSSVQQETLLTGYLVPAPQLCRSLQRPRTRTKCNDKLLI